ncbi:AraC family transcriptional regulator [Pseudomonas aestusnigri]|jgi:AraC-like DNA-binding protein|uniref:AraC family transcriptional regulator n=1 Tax=Halopseudomonas aestusnigri TaxID=857252 RepID=UPI001D1807EA|nr:AraC family transcriptional regulator [Halopseudomonas aestusnigri]MCC4261442.1 AraC family transcriptional regulator [Halopseudomonas aestusnigri]
MKLGDISVGYLLSLREVVQQLGHDPAPLLSRFRITDELLAQPHARISIPRFMRLGNAAIRYTREPAIGLLMGQSSRISHLGLTGMAAQCAPTLRAAFSTMIEFELLGSQNYRGHSSFEPPAVRFYSISPYNMFNLFVVDSALAARARIGRDLTGGRAQLREVHIEFPAPPYAARYEAVFGCPVHFEQSHNQIVWEPRSLDLPLEQSAAATHADLRELCRQRLSELTRHRGLRERVETLVAPQLDGQPPTLAEVATTLGLPAWTLRRRLQQEAGTGYQNIIDDMRRDLAVTYIRDTEMALGEISFLLGFSSPEAFQRAFKRWTGAAPGSYRKAIFAENKAEEYLKQ